MLNDSMYSSEKKDWETPDFLFKALDNEFNFNLDPCSDGVNAKCKSFFTKAEDGLTKEWEGSIFMNPPYGRGIEKWMEKALNSSKAGALVCCLVPARTDTRWWHNYAMKGEVRLLSKRLTFKGANNKAPFPCAIVIFKPHGHSLTTQAI